MSENFVNIQFNIGEFGDFDRKAITDCILKIAENSKKMGWKEWSNGIDILDDDGDWVGWAKIKGEYDDIY